MSTDETEIPLVGRLESADAQLVLSRPAASDDRRIENWIASNLDLDGDRVEENHWNRLIGNLPVFRRRPDSRRGGEGATTPSNGGWSRFQVVYRRGFTIVRVVDQSLVNQGHIEEMGRDLTDLIEVGNHRLILNFSAVERLGSWIIGVVAAALRRCEQADGGKLKLCGLDPQLAEIFPIVGMNCEIVPDETAAIEGPWPPRTGSRQLPVEILMALGTLSEIPAISGGAPVDRMESAAMPSSVLETGSRGSRPPVENQRAPGRAVTLLVQIRDSAPRGVALSSGRLLIGRERPCKLRLGSAQVSKQHAVVEQREGRVWLRDLASTNGTMVNGRKIHDEEVELLHDDRIQIGPVSATVVIDQTGGRSPTTDAVDELSANLSALDATATAIQRPAPATEELPQIDDSDLASRIKHEILEDVLIVTPQIPELEGDLTLEALRETLRSFQEQPLPRRVVVNLEFVNHLSRQAIALLLAHHVRLEWAGGALRLCQAHARIIAMLDQVRLTMLVDCYPTVDEAVLSSWTSMSRSPA